MEIRQTYSFKLKQHLVENARKAEIQIRPVIEKALEDELKRKGLACKKCGKAH